jgi:tripartite-type tricarboxylate transporter receptor subunit TctC
MKHRPSRRIFALAVILASCGGNLAYAQSKPVSYPTKPVRLLVGLAPGGALDLFMRELAQKLSASWGQGVIVENRPGASGVLAMDLVAKAPPNGYTLLAGTNAVVTQMLLGKTSYDVRKAFAPIVRLTSQSYILVVNNSVPAGSVKELLALAKSKPGTLSYASSGTGAASHLGFELIKYMSGTDMLHVPYKGLAQAVPDLLSGQVQMMFALSLLVGPHIKAGKLKPLAVTSLERSRTLPDLPTVSEAGVPGFTITSDYGLHAPAGTPPEIVDLINRVSAQIMNSPEMRKRLEAENTDAAAPNTPAEFRKSIEQDFARLDKFIKATGFKAD